MTEREIFDKVSAHLMQQLEPAENSTGCVYRADDGKKCAVGALIPDELYDPIIEEGVVSHIGKPIDRNTYFGSELAKMERRYEALERILVASVGELTRRKKDLLVALQELHDDGSPSTWCAKLGSVERQFFGDEEYDGNCQ